MGMFMSGRINDKFLRFTSELLENVRGLKRK